MPTEETTTTTTTGATPETTTTTEEQFPEGLGDTGKAALKAERDARKAAEKAASEHAKELETLRKEKADRDAAKATADEEEAKRKGEFETLAEKRKAEADAAKADADAKGKDLERATKRLQAVVDAGIKELEATEDKDLIAGFPKDAPLLDQADWLDDPRTRAAIRAASEDKKVVDAQKKPRVPITPKPNGNGNEPDEAARKRLAARYQ